MKICDFRPTQFVVRPTLFVGGGVLLLVALGVLLFMRGGPSPAERETAEALSAASARDPTLKGKGKGQAPENPYADVTDLPTLLDAAGGGNEAQRRLLALVEEDPRRTDALVAWMHPDQDARRRQRWAGVSYSGPLHPADRALCDTFSRMGSAGVQALIGALDDANAEQRRRAATCLGNIGARAAASAVPALLARLEGDREDAGGQAVMLRALGVMGSAAAEALPVFHDVLRDENRPDVVREAAAENFLDLAGATDEAFATCTAVLRDQAFDVCNALLHEIALLGAEAAPLAPVLVDLIRDDTAHGVVVRNATYALRAIGSADRATVASLVVIAGDERRENALRTAAAHAVATFGDAAVDDLLEAIDASDDDTRLLLVNALAGSGIDVRRLLALLDALRASEWEDDRICAVAAAERLQAPADVFVPWLRPWLKDPHPLVRRTVLGAVELVRDDEGLVAALLAEAGDDPVMEVRRGVLYRVNLRWDEDLGDRAHLRSKALVDAALRGFEAADPLMRMAAAEALARIAPEYDERALSYWIHAADSHDWPNRAVEVLERMGPRAKDAIPVLKRLRERWKDYEPARKDIDGALEAIRGTGE